MIADFLVDYQYLADLLSHDSNGRALTLVKMLCSLVDYDNVRLIVDTELKCLNPLKEIGGATASSGTNGSYKRVLEWFCDEMKNLHKFRRVKGYAEKDFYRTLNPSPFVVITDETHPGAGWCEKFLTLEDYFRANDKEKKRIKIGLKNSFGRNLKPLDELKEAVARFCAGDNEFTIIDRYALGGGDLQRLERCCSNIARWAYMISNGGINSCTIKIYANGGVQSDGALKSKLSIATSLQNTWRHLTGGQAGDRSIVEFYLVPGDGLSLRDDRFHDRFLCSQTRILGIGKGMDIYDGNGNVTCVNLQYCGRRVGDTLIDQLVKMQTLPPFKVELKKL